MTLECVWMFSFFFWVLQINVLCSNITRNKSIGHSKYTFIAIKNECLKVFWGIVSSGQILPFKQGFSWRNKSAPQLIFKFIWVNTLVVLQVLTVPYEYISTEFSCNWICSFSIHFFLSHPTIITYLIQIINKL